MFQKQNATSLELDQFQAEAENIIRKIELCDAVVKKIIVSKLTHCRECNSKLQIKQRNPKLITLYNSSEGTEHAEKYTKFCRICSIYEHAGYYSKDDKRIIDMANYHRYEIILSTDETAFSKKMLETYQWELVIGQISFLTKANIYNRTFGYEKTTSRKKKV